MKALRYILWIVLLATLPAVLAPRYVYEVPASDNDGELRRTAGTLNNACTGGKTVTTNATTIFIGDALIGATYYALAGYYRFGPLPSETIVSDTLYIWLVAKQQDCGSVIASRTADWYPLDSTDWNIGIQESKAIAWANIPAAGNWLEFPDLAVAGAIVPIKLETGNQCTGPDPTAREDLILASVDHPTLLFRPYFAVNTVSGERYIITAVGITGGNLGDASGQYMGGKR
jgi:hypothetical protein